MDANIVWAVTPIEYHPVHGAPAHRGCRFGNRHTESVTIEDGLLIFRNGWADPAVVDADFVEFLSRGRN